MDNPYMLEAIALSVQNVRSAKGGPFAALVVKDGGVVARGTNLVTERNDPTAHAEIVAMRSACHSLGSFHLTGCDLYTTCEPCPMCLGAIYWARLDRVFFAATDEDAARYGFDDSLIYEQVRLPWSQRELPMIQVMREEALKSFLLWQESARKVLY